jgi:hypothetical protein
METAEAVNPGIRTIHLDDFQKDFDAKQPKKPPTNDPEDQEARSDQEPGDGPGFDPNDPYSSFAEDAEQARSKMGGDIYGEPSEIFMMQARYVAKFLDFLLSSLLAYIAKDQDNSRWKATDSEMEDIIYIWAMYLEDTGTNIPIWAMLLLTMAMVYGFKVPRAIRYRREGLRVAYRKDGSSKSDGVEEVSAEEITDEELSDEADLEIINQRARELGLDELATVKHRPEGACKWYWHIEGRFVEASGQGFQPSFSNPSVAVQWSNLLRKYASAGIDTTILKY